INRGTDLALFNAWMTHIADKGWVDKAFVDASTTNFDQMKVANKISLEDAAKITGLTADQIRKSAEWIAQPKAGNARRRAMFAYEKGLIWGNDNYRTNGALVNVALATGNIGRRWLRAHGRAPGRLLASLRRACGTARRVRRPTSDRRQGRCPSHLGMRPLQDHAERIQVQASVQEAYRHGEGCHDDGALWRPRRDDQRDRRRDQEGRAVCRRRRYRADQD